MFLYYLICVAARSRRRLPASLSLSLGCTSPESTPHLPLYKCSAHRPAGRICKQAKLLGEQTEPPGTRFRLGPGQDCHVGQAFLLLYVPMRFLDKLLGVKSQLTSSKNRERQGENAYVCNSFWNFPVWCSRCFVRRTHDIPQSCFVFPWSKCSFSGTSVPTARWGFSDRASPSAGVDGPPL